MSADAEPILLAGSGAVPAAAGAAPPPKGFLAHARLIALLTFFSRIFGLLRESASGYFLGTGLVASAFTVAFTIPNLFRKLFGEGALAAAFIPLYAQSLKTQSRDQADHFAAASVNLLALVLLALTLLGEVVLGLLIWSGATSRPDLLLTLKLTAIMLPYVLLICGTAFLGAILQVHQRFGVPAAAPILLNIIHITVLITAGWILKLHLQPDSPALLARQTTLAYWLSGFVLVAGVLQLLILLPSLKAVGFRFRWRVSILTPTVRKMLRLSVPVGLAAGVLQMSVLIDKGISATLAQHPDATGKLATHFALFGYWLRYPMELGAVTRLNWAQFLYQFPLGIFAISLATAIFPGLSADALDKDRARFRSMLRRGMEATLFEGIAASVGLVLVAYPAIRLLLQHGRVTPHDTDLMVRSLTWYAAGVWAFSLLQIINRAFYALQDTRTPLVMMAVNLLLNVVVEVPLLWTPLAESAMAVGTLVSFSVQAVWMLWLLEKRVGDLRLGQLLTQSIKMLLAAGAMAAACLLLQRLPYYPTGTGNGAAILQLLILMSVGAGVYLLSCHLLGLQTLQTLRRKKVAAQNKS